MQYAVCNNECSTKRFVSLCAPGGFVLGPLFFLLYIKDLSDNKDAPLKLFAEDCIFYTSIASCEGKIVLNDAFIWQMKINYATCKQSPFHFEYNMSGNMIKSVRVQIFRCKD